MYKANRPLPSVGSIPAVQTRWASKTQPNAVASGIRLLARSPIDYPAVGALLVRLGGAAFEVPNCFSILYGVT
jgi:hypothetical protein